MRAGWPALPAFIPCEYCHPAHCLADREGCIRKHRCHAQQLREQIEREQRESEHSD